MPLPARSGAVHRARPEAGSLAAPEQVGDQAQERRHRQTHHVPVVALDLLHESRSPALDRVGAGALAPLARRQVPGEIGRLEPAEADPRHGHVAALRAVRLADRDAAHDLVGAPGQAPEEGLGLLFVARLAPRELLHVRRLRPEGDPELLEDRPSLGRARRKYQSAGKNSPISRAADSAESEPWTRLVWTSRPKSPRMEPGDASSGFVAPITWRAAATASWPSSTSATSGPPVMNSTRSPKKGRSACSA